MVVTMITNVCWDFDIHVTVHGVKFLIINQLDALISQIYSWNETLHMFRTEELSETCVEFHSKNKFEKLVHLIGLL